MPSRCRDGHVCPPDAWPHRPPGGGGDERAGEGGATMLRSFVIKSGRRQFGVIACGTCIGVAFWIALPELAGSSRKV